MARLYLDYNIAIDVQAALVALGHMADHTRESPRMMEAKDGHQLLYAVERGSILLTHDRKDFPTIHDAWRRWSAAWGCGPPHAGVLMVEQRVPPEMLADVVDKLINSGAPLVNELYNWTPATGWEHWPYEP